MLFFSTFLVFLLAAVLSSNWFLVEAVGNVRDQLIALPSGCCCCCSTCWLLRLAAARLRRSSERVS